MDVSDDFYSLVEEMFSWESMEDFLINISRHINSKLGAERSTLFIYDGQDDALKSVVFLARMEEKITIPLSTPSIAGSSFKAGKPIIVDDITDTAYLRSVNLHYHECWKTVEDINPTKNMMSVPIFFKDKPVGVFVAVNKLPRFEQKDVDYVVGLSRLIAVAIKNLEKQVQLHYMNLLNRKIIDTVSAGIIVTDGKFRVEYVNGTLLEMTGFRYTLSDITGKDIYTVFGFLERLKDKIEEAVVNNISQDFVVGILRVKVVPIVSNYLFEPRISNIIFVIES